MLRRIQNDMFDVGADIATPENVDFEALRIEAEQVERLESEIDTMNAELDPLDSFILPGGKPAVANLYLARAVVRRAERSLVALSEGEWVNPHALAYINRLSDHLFVMARLLAKADGGDIKWVPGANR